MGEQLSPILRRLSDNVIGFWCPGCDEAHVIRYGAANTGLGWTWNGSVDRPTLTPSVLAFGHQRCHSFVTDGKIQFLSDCTHSLVNQTVALPPWPQGMETHYE